MFEITDDYLAAQEHLKALLNDVDGVRSVNYLLDLADIKEETQRTPCLHLMYYGDQLPETSNGGAYMPIKQTWLVIVVVRQSRTENAGELITRTIKALAGKKAGPTGPWLRVNTPAKPRFSDGFAYYPLAFTSQMRLKGA